MLDIDDTFKNSFLPDHLNQVRVLSISDPFHEHMLNFICYYNDWKKPITYKKCWFRSTFLTFQTTNHTIIYNKEDFICLGLLWGLPSKRKICEGSFCCIKEFDKEMSKVFSQ